MPSAQGRLWLRLADLDDRLEGSRPAGEALRLASEAFKAAGDEDGLGDACMGLAHQERFRAYSLPKCRALLAQARAHYDAAGSVEGAARAVALLAETWEPDLCEDKAQGLARCEALFPEAAELFQKAGDQASAVNCLARLTKLLGQAGRKDAEEELFARTLSLIEKHFDGPELARNYEVASRFFAERGQPERSELYRSKAEAFKGGRRGA